jgi:hypothetical protein
MVVCILVAAGANVTTTPTFAPDGLAAKTITKKGGVALAAGDIPGEHAVCILEYNLAHTRWELLNPAVTAPTFATGAEEYTGTEAAKVSSPSTGKYIKGRPDLTNLLYPSQNGGHRDIVRAGWKPAFFNQQWGGAPILGGLDGDLKMDYATGYNEQDTAGLVGYDNTNQYLAQGFKVGQTITVQAIWIKMYKVLNPTANFTVEIYDDNAGAPNAVIANGSATVQAGTLHTSDTNGAWYRFVFATPPSCAANTLFWIVCDSSAANSTTNYWKVCAMVAGKYPHGLCDKGSNVPAWSAYASVTDICFAVEPVAAKQMIQSGGAFDYKLVGNEGTPLDQSYGLTASLKDIGFNPYEFTWKGTFTNLAKSKPFAEFMYGLDHDRISLATDSDGHVNLVIYEDNATVHTIAGTTDVSSGTYDIGIYVRAKGDGSDVATLYINGTADDSHTSLTLTFDYIAFRELGTAWLLGGFPVCPAWTGTYDGVALPSASIPVWDYAGTANEASHYVVSGGKLYQQIVGSTDTSYFVMHTAATFNNANGWEFIWKSKVIKASDVTLEAEATIEVLDGTKQVYVYHHTYYIETGQLATNFKVQIDSTKEHVLRIISTLGMLTVRQVLMLSG